MAAKKKIVKKTAKVEKKVSLVKLTHPRVNPKSKIHEETGTRFAEGSYRQEAYDMVILAISEGKDRKGINAVLAAEGYPTSYFTRVVAAHPERFRVFSDGKVEVTPKKSW